MPETINLGPLQLRFFSSKDDIAGSLDMFEMTVQPNASCLYRIIIKLG